MKNISKNFASLVIMVLLAACSASDKSELLARQQGQADEALDRLNSDFSGVGIRFSSVLNEEDTLKAVNYISENADAYADEISKTAALWSEALPGVENAAMEEVILGYGWNRLYHFPYNTAFRLGFSPLDLSEFRRHDVTPLDIARRTLALERNRAQLCIEGNCFTYFINVTQAAIIHTPAERFEWIKEEFLDDLANYIYIRAFQPQHGRATGVEKIIQLDAMSNVSIGLLEEEARRLEVFRTTHKEDEEDELQILYERVVREVHERDDIRFRNTRGDFARALRAGVPASDFK